MESDLIQEKIVGTASELFYKKGYNKTKVNDIVKESGISKKVLEEYFESKEDICIAYLRFRNENFSKELLSFVDQVTEGKDKILAVFNYLELFYQMKNFDGCWAVKVFSEVSCEETRIREEVAFQKRDLINFIETLIQKHIKSGDSTKNSKMLAQNIYLLLETAVVQSNILKEEWPITNAKAMCEKLLD